MTTTQVPWDEGTWLNEPPDVDYQTGSLVVTTKAHSDLWRTTSYGFVRDSGHALLIDFPQDSAVEVSFIADFANQFDQAGVLVRADEAHWTKAGVEISDGELQAAAVVTREVSDWSTSPMPHWRGKEVRIRVSRTGDALTVRAGIEGQLDLIRLTPLDPSLTWQVGPFCCSPSDNGVVVRFTKFTMGLPDRSLHPVGEAGSTK